jgi:hypothetical protein
MAVALFEVLNLPLDQICIPDINLRVRVGYFDNVASFPFGGFQMLC